MYTYTPKHTQGAGQRGGEGGSIKERAGGVEGESERERKRVTQGEVVKGKENTERKQEKECREQEESSSRQKAIIDAISFLSSRELGGLKSTMKILKNSHTNATQQTDITHKLLEWLEKEKEEKSIEGLIKTLTNWLEGHTHYENAWTQPTAQILQTLDRSDATERERGRLTRLFLTRAQTQGCRVPEIWATHLKKQGKKIESEIVCEWVREWQRKSKGQERNRWEQFTNKYIPQAHTKTHTTTQTCDIVLRKGKTQQKQEVKTVVVWNGNGVRARWGKEKNELKEITHATNPDVLCFLEAKTNVDN